MKRPVLATLLVLAAACSGSPPPQPSAPIAPVTGKDAAAGPSGNQLLAGYPVAQTGGGTVGVPLSDPAKMKELEAVGGRVQVAVQWPREDQVIPQGTGPVQYTVTGFAIGREADLGSCHLLLDNRPWVADLDHTTTLEALNGGKPVAEGSHLLTVFPARRSGISLKCPGACAQVRFHVKTKKGDLPKPTDQQIVANLPQGAYDSSKGEAHNVLCDFQILGVDLEGERHMKFLNAVITIERPDGKKEKLRAFDWGALVVLTDPKPGRYKVTVELEERDDGDPIDVPFAETTREVVIE